MKLYIFVLLALAACAQGRFFSEVAFPEVTRSGPDGRIIDGSPAAEGQFPYQVFIIVTSITGQRSACGASLISPTWVLTAGHCVSGFIAADIHLGSVNYADSPIIISTNRLVPHPEYSILGLRNDIGLIGLPVAVELTDNIQPIGLPTDPEITYSGRRATVSGFGLTVDGGSVSPVLNFAPVEVISNIVCLISYPINVRETVLCTRGVDTPAQGTCNGDSGGPLVLEDANGVMKQIGIVSFGSSSGCAADSPKGYVRPYHYIPWITEVTGIDFN